MSQEFAAPVPAAPAAAYAEWPKRVAATIIDALPVIAIAIVIGIISGIIHSAAVGLLLSAIQFVAIVGWWIYNYGIQQGTTGHTLGKGLMGIKLIREDNGQPIGTGMAIGRGFVHIIDGIPCYVGYLWPLWDDKKQTFTDKVLKTIVVDSEKHTPDYLANLQK